MAETSVEKTSPGSASRRLALEPWGRRDSCLGGSHHRLSFWRFGSVLLPVLLMLSY